MFIALKVTNHWLGCAQMQLKEYSIPPLKMQSISEIPNHLSFITVLLLSKYTMLIKKVIGSLQ